MNNTKKNIYIALLIISIISNMILLYKKYPLKILLNFISDF